MPEAALFESMISCIVQAGAVDGVTGLHKETVDGLDIEWERNIYMEMFRTASDMNYIPGAVK
jgi:hypothetical protein